MKLLAFAMAALLCQMATAAEIRVDTDKGSFTINGEIKPGDDVVFASIIKGRKGTTMIYLTSPGGDIDTAIHIGRTIRAHDGWVWVPDQCDSACVLMFAGGNTRFGSDNIFANESEATNVGVHRVYFGVLQAGLTQAQVKAAYDAQLARVRTYLRDMDVAPEFLSYMQSIEPESIHKMTEGELIRYGLGPGDVVADEKNTADQAAMYGITSAELRERKKRSLDSHFPNGECKNIDALPTEVDRGYVAKSRVKITIEQKLEMDCAQAIEFGTSIQVFQERDAKEHDLCAKYTEGQNNSCYIHYMTTGNAVP